IMKMRCPAPRKPSRMVLPSPSPKASNSTTEIVPHVMANIVRNARVFCARRSFQNSCRRMIHMGNLGGEFGAGSRSEAFDGIQPGRPASGKEAGQNGDGRKQAHGRDQDRWRERGLADALLRSVRQVG